MTDGPMIESLNPCRECGWSAKFCSCAPQPLVISCNCADTPPTMPTYRDPDDHLESCPLSHWVIVRKRI